MKLLKRMLAAVLTMCLLVTAVPVTAFGLVLDNEITAANYYEIKSSSGKDVQSSNGNTKAHGILVDNDGNAYIVISYGNKAVVEIKINGTPIEEFKSRDQTKLTINLPDNNPKTLTANKGFLLAPINSLSEISESFSLHAKVQNGQGWNIASDKNETEPIDVSVNIGYEITKTVEKISDDEGEKLQYMITVSNTGDQKIHNIDVYDNVPGGITVISVDDVPKEVSGGNRLELGDNISLDPKGQDGASKTYKVIAVVNSNFPGGEIINTATMSSGALEEKQASVKYTVNRDYTIDKEVKRVGNELHYTVTAKNTGDYTIPNISIYDDVPKGITITSVTVDDETKAYELKGSEGLNELALAAGDLSLAADETKIYTVTAVVNEDFAGGEIKNTVTMKCAALEPVQDTAEITIDLGYDIVKTVEVVDSTELKYTIIAENTGDYRLFNVDIYDILPEEIDITSVTEIIKENNTEIEKSIVDGNKLELAKGITLEEDEVRTYIVTAVVNDKFAGGEIKNIVTMDCDALDAITDDATTSITKEYTVEKTVAKDASDDEKLIYTITVKNAGEVSISDIVVYDVVPEEITVKTVGSKEVTENDYTDDGLVVDSDLDLAPGDSKTYRITAVVNDSFTSGTISNTAIADNGVLQPVSDTADVELSYFYVCHSKTGVTEKIAISDSLKAGTEKFNLTVAGSAGTTYTGLSSGSLYGGTFIDDKYSAVYLFASDENGIGFTPEAGKTYYVHEPSNVYLRPMSISVWKSTDNVNTLVSLHTVTAVDRLQYKLVGTDVVDVDESNEGSIISKKDLNDDKVYETVKVTIANNNGEEIYTSSENFKKEGYLACIEVKDFKSYGSGNIFVVRPYWITLDGVKVTGRITRSLVYDEDKYTIQTANNLWGNTTFDIVGPSMVSASELTSSSTSLLSYYNALLSADSFFDSEETPAAPDPSTVTVNMKHITAGKSDSVKSLDLSYSLEGFDYQEAGFVVNAGKKDEIITVEVDENGMVSTIYSLNSLKKNATIQITPYWITEDGETLYGNSLTATYTKNKTVE